VVFELRYRFGYTYLDRCGRAINAITRESPEWIPIDQASPQNTPLISLINRCVFNFSSIKMDFALERLLDSEIEDRDVEHFKGQVDLISRIVIDQLGLSEFSRIGLRAWYVFRCPSKEESESWLRNLGLYTVSPDLQSAFGAELESIGLAVVIKGDDRMFRVSFNGVEQVAQVDRGAEFIAVNPRQLSKDQDKILKKQVLQRSSQFAAMIDIDTYLDDPLGPDPRDFIETSLQLSLKGLKSATQAK
jgi:hypothetical protein